MWTKKLFLGTLYGMPLYCEVKAENKQELDAYIEQIQKHFNKMANAYKDKVYANEI